MYCTILYAGTLWRIKMFFLKSVFCSWQNWVAATSHPSFCSHTCVASSLSGFSKQSGVWWCVSSGHNVITQSPDFISKKNLLLTWHNKPFHTSNTIDNCSILKIRKLRHRRPEVRCLKHIRGERRCFLGLSQFPCSLGLPMNHIYWETHVTESATFVGASVNLVIVFWWEEHYYISLLTDF